MLYSENIKKALLIAYNAHMGQVDKGGYPYIFHPYHIAEQMDTEEETITAILHDTIEDTDITVEYLKAQGFSQNVLDTLELLTRKENEDYFEYVKRVCENKIAMKIKLADLNHNLDSSRTGTEISAERNEKYRKAVLLIENSRKKHV